MKHNPRLLAAAFTVAGAFALSACAAPEVPMQPAENSNDPACADVIIRLPDEAGGLERRRTNAQSTGAWGDPSAVLLYCGIEPSGPTTDDCVSVNGVDWIIDRSNDPMFRFEAYGREPGVEVIVDAELASGTDTIIDLNNAVAQLPQTRECSSVIDDLEFG